MLANNDEVNYEHDMKYIENLRYHNPLLFCNDEKDFVDINSTSTCRRYTEIIGRKTVGFKKILWCVDFSVTGQASSPNSLN